MDDVFISNLRCFAGIGWIKLAPLTLLIGENSTGKSSFLAATRLAWDLAYGHEIDFNEEPFQLGAFDQLAHVYGGAKGRAKTIELGYRARAGEEVVEIRTTLVQDGSQALVHESHLTVGNTKAVMRRDPETDKLTIHSQRGTVVSEAQAELGPALPRNRLTWDLVPYVIMRAPGQSDKSRDALVHRLMNATQRMREAQSGRPYAFAPVRTKPLRTYDPIKLAPQPEGDHVPMLLARMCFSDDRSWQRLRTSLESFGKASGLFQKLDVRTLGKSESDPFQLRVKVSGPLVNLVDVGYGVSQILPLLVETLSDSGARTLLMQQPEVHLHPRAQAELGSFLGTLVRERGRRFIIETHSDYTIDRIRADIRDERGLRPQDVAILYFERRKGSVHIHRLEIDKEGNLKGAPSGYRDFFLTEQRRSLGL